MKRALLLLLALLLPVGGAIGVALFALPGMLPSLGINTTSIKARTEATVIIPDTLEDAKKLTMRRLGHLQSLTQAQWDIERKAIAHKYPPETIEAAIARAKWRLDDLNRMTSADWEEDKKRLLRRKEALAEP